MDILIIFILGLALSGAMQKNGTWKPLSGIGDFIAWGVVCALALALVRIPIYLIVCGAHFPFNPSTTLQLVSGAIAIFFWWAMAYWRIPMRLMGRKG
jgi:hypothetical protein